MNKPVIALDADGVLFDYEEAYHRLWEHCFDQEFLSVSPSIHVETAEHVEKRGAFYTWFDKHGWHEMHALPHAIEATHLLREAGYQIIVVTSVTEDRCQIRHNRLNHLGFAIDATIATGRKTSADNPKKKWIDYLKPEYFVDDLLENFKGVDKQTQCVLIESEDWAHPNLKFQQPLKLHSTHFSLMDFVRLHIL